MSTAQIPEALAIFFRQHNRRATFLAMFCLLGSALSWALVYGAILWVELLFLTTIRGVDAPSAISVRPHFLIAAAVLLGVGLLVRRWKTQNEKFHLGLALFTLLSIPARLTFAIWDNFFARVYPSAKELEECWKLLDFLREEKKLATTHVATVLSPSAQPKRIVYLLSITELIDTDRYSGIYYHHLRNEDASQMVLDWTGTTRLQNEKASEITSSQESNDNREAK